MKRSVLCFMILLGVCSLGWAQEEEELDPAKLHFSGYGDIKFNTRDSGTSGGGKADAHYFVLGWEYEFTDSLRLESEVDFEHAAREMELEYAYLEYDLLAGLSLRGGVFLMPVGPFNEFHEPPLFYSVQRPYMHTQIIPGTWQEMGVGAAGRIGDIAYRVYGINGLNAEKFDSVKGCLLYTSPSPRD